MTDKEILWEVNNFIATITINRPKVGNALSKDNYAQIQSLMTQFAEDDAVRVIVMTSSGNNFSAGGDVTQFLNAIEEQTYIPYDIVRETGFMIESMIKHPKPIIAAVEGFAVGAGFGLAMACDFIVLSQSTRLISGFINMGLPGDTGLLYKLYGALGSYQTRKHVMLNIPIDAKTAYDKGLAYEVVEDGQALSAAYVLAEKLANGPTQSYAYQKALLASLEYPQLDQFNQLESQFMHKASKHKQHQIAVEAFINKKQPDFN